MLLLINLLIKLIRILHQPAQCWLSATVMGGYQSSMGMLACKALHVHTRTSISSDTVG